MTRPATRKGVGKADKTKNATGRPSLFRDEYIRQAREFALLGVTDEEMARLFGVSEATFNSWKNSKPGFLDSIKEGRDVADARVGTRLYERAMGYSHKAVKIVADAKTGAVVEVPYTEHYPPDTAACIFWLKNRQRHSGRWRDKVEQAITGEDGGAVKVDMTVAIAGPALDAMRAKLAAIVDGGS